LLLVTFFVFWIFVKNKSHPWMGEPKEQSRVLLCSGAECAVNTLAARGLAQRNLFWCWFK
jgi:hypothetical protein